MTDFGERHWCICGHAVDNHAQGCQVIVIAMDSETRRCRCKTFEPRGDDE